MTSALSSSIVYFISSLLPLYVSEVHNEVLCARSLSDGTLILPTIEDEDNENGVVEIHWQGDATRSTKVQGCFLASVAIARYVELHAIADGKNRELEFSDLSNHFTFKTGASIVFGANDSAPEVYKWISKVTDRLGTQAVIEILRKAAGGF
jgi:hypothetical protein